MEGSLRLFTGPAWHAWKDSSWMFGRLHLYLHLHFVELKGLKTSISLKLREKRDEVTL